MEIKICIKEGVTVEDAMNTLVKIAAISQKIEVDIHTNKHYELRNGRMWMKGDGTGKYWDLLCNSRDGQRDAKDIMNIF